MFCPKCGEVIDDKAVICPKCGASTSVNNTPQNVPVNPIPAFTPTAPVAPPKKKNGCLIAVLICVGLAVLTIIIIAVSGGGNDTKTTDANGNQVTTKAVTPTTITAVTPTTIIDESAIEAARKQQPLYVTSAKLVIQSDEYKALYPDMLQAIIYNNTNTDIKNAVIAFAAWDKNNLPIKISGQFDFTDGAYIKKVNYSDINLVGGASFGNDNGYELEDGLNVKSIKAIVVSYETFSGELWNNPYFDVFCTLFEGKKIS